FTNLNPGVTAAEIDDALAKCPSNQVVFLRTGTYDLNDTIHVRGNGVTLRGSGPDKTILNNTQISIIGLDNDYPHDPPPFVADWTCGFARGTTNLTLSTTAGLQVGNILVLDQLNAGEVHRSGEGCSSCSRSDGARYLQQYVEVKRIVGNSVDI